MLDGGLNVNYFRETLVINFPLRWPPLEFSDFLENRLFSIYINGRWILKDTLPKKQLKLIQHPQMESAIINLSFREYQFEFSFFATVKLFSG
jgi:hypothetical protein